MKGWAWYLHDAMDMRRLGEFTSAHTPSIDVGLNVPQSGSFQIDTRIPVVNMIEPFRTAVVGVKNGKPKVAGYIINPNETLDQVNQYENSGMLTVNWMGWMDKYSHRIVRPPQEPKAVFQARDAGEIAWALHDIAEEQYPLRIKKGLLEKTQDRTISYSRGTNIGGSMKALADLEAGFDYEVTPFERELNIRNYIGEFHPEVIWGFNYGPHNIEKITENEDTGIFCDAMYAVGSSGNAAYVSDDEAIAKYDFLSEEYNTLAGITDNTNNILLAYAGEEVAIRAMPYVSWDITPMPYTPGSPVPSSFEDFNVGDVNSLYKIGGRHEVLNQAIRIFTFSLQISDDGQQETITKLTTTYA